MAAYSKLPGELFDIYKDFAKDLGSDTITSIVSVTSMNERTGADSTAEIIATNPAPSIVGTKIYYWVQGGAVPERHRITIEIQSSGGRKFADTDQLTIWSGA